MCHLRVSFDPFLPEVRLRVGEVGDLFAVSHNFCPPSHPVEF